MYVSKSRVASICFVPVSVFLLTCGTTYVVLIPSLGIESSVLMQVAGRDGSVGGGSCLCFLTSSF
jgi:hypothetical protein